MENKVSIILIIIIVVMVIAIAGRLVYVAIKDNEDKQNNAIDTISMENDTSIRQDDELNKRIELTEDEKIKLNELFADYVTGSWLMDSDSIVFDERNMVEFSILIAGLKYEEQLIGFEEQPYSSAYEGQVTEEDKIYASEELISEIINIYFNVENIEYSQDISDNYHPDINAFETYTGLGGNRRSL